MTGLSSIEPPPATEFNEPDLAKKLVTAVGRISDLDERLAKDPDLCSNLTESSADLLASAGYDREEYLRWVGDGEPTSLG